MKLLIKYNHWGPLLYLSTFLSTLSIVIVGLQVHCTAGYDKVDRKYFYCRALHWR